MYLAMNKYGQLGRKIPSMGDNAVIAPPVCADRTSSVIVNPNMAIADSDYWNSVAAAQEDLVNQTQMTQEEINQNADEVYAQANAQMLAYQNDVPEDQDQAALRRYYAMLNTTPESVKSAMTVRADFSMATQVPGEPFTTPTLNPMSDFNQNELVGNPLTRDGSYGVVTDWDRFVKGTEMQNSEVHTNNSIMYRLPQAQMGRQGGRRRSRRRLGDEFDDAAFQEFDAMPDDSSGGAIDVTSQTTAPAASTSSSPSWLSSLFSSASSTAQAALNKQVASTKAGTAANPVTGKTITAIQAGTIMGLPSVVFYGAVAMIGIGVVFVAMKKANKI